MKLYSNPTDFQVLFFSAIEFIFGLLLCFCSHSILMIASRIIGVFVLAYGAYLLYLYYIKQKQISHMPAFIGIPCVIFGIFMLISPESLIAIIPVLTGILLIINSMIQMQKAFLLKQLRFNEWSICFWTSVILMIVGTIILLHPIQMVTVILKIDGVALALEAIVQLYYQYEQKKYLRYIRRQSRR